MKAANNISDAEYAKLIKKLEFFVTTRNMLLTFSFTAVLAVLGIAIGTDSMDVSYWVCLVPYFLIIPFAARIAYYRLASAHINSFLKMFAPEKMIFENGASGKAHERCGKMYPLIAWLVNHEMFILSVATEIVFILKLHAQVDPWTYKYFLVCIIPTLFSVVVLLISSSTFNYGKLTGYYNVQWKQYFDEIQSL